MIRFSRRRRAEREAVQPSHVRPLPTIVPVFDFETAAPADQVELWLAHSYGAVEHFRERRNGGDGERA